MLQSKLVNKQRLPLGDIYSAQYTYTPRPILCYTQGRNHRGGHGGRVPRAPYHVLPTSK